MSGSILLTGASGFLGRALLRELLASGVDPHSLRCLVRQPASLDEFGLPPGALIRGDLAAGPHWEHACRGVTLCYHIAGVVKALNKAGYLAGNATGTSQLVNALGSFAAGARLVHVSSLAAAGPSRDGSTSGISPERCRPPSQYGESKRLGELAVLASQSLRWVIVRPPVIYGPGDGGSRFLLKQALARICPVPSPPRPLSVIQVRDVVRALLLCASSDRHGIIVPLDGPDRFDTDSLMQTIAATCGRRARLVHAPLWLARLAALPVEAWARLTRRPGIFSLDKLREVAAVGWVADPTPARELVGFVASIRAREGFAELAAAHGLVLR